MKENRPAQRAVAQRLKAWSWAIFFTALLVRLLHLAQIKSAPFFELLLGDARGYDAWARQIAAGDLVGQEIFYQAPLYPYFLGTIYTLFEPDLLLVRLIQALIGAASCVLLAAAARRYFSRSAGIVAGFMLACYAPAIFFDGLLQKSVLDLFFLCLILWLLSRATPDARRATWFWIGLSLGALILTRENAMVLVPAIAVWLFWDPQLKLRRRLTCCSLFLLGLATMLLPIAIRNQQVGGEFHLTTSQFGSNLYIGNNPAATGSYISLRPGRGSPEFERVDATELAQQAEGRTLTPAEVSAFWTGRALDYISSQPGDWLKLLGKKSAMLCNAAEFVDTEDQYTYADRSWPLRLTGYLFHFGLIAPLALCGICITWRERHRLWLLYLMLVLFAGSVLLFYVVARYRFPLVPILMLFAAAGLVRLPRFLKSVPPLQRAVYLGVLALALVFCNWPLQSRDLMRATTLSNMGSASERQGRLDEATDYYNQALAYAPDYANVHYNLGIVSQRKDDPAAAIEHYEQAVQIDPQHAKAHSNLAGLLLNRGRFEEAIEHCRAALQVAPDQARTHRIWAQALLAQGKLHEALGRLEGAIKADPAWPVPKRELAWILATSPEGALRDPQRALLLAEEAVQLTQGNDAKMLDALGAAYAAVQRFDEAVAISERARSLALQSGDRHLAERIDRRLQLYRRSEPYLSQQSR